MKSCEIVTQVIYVFVILHPEISICETSPESWAPVLIPGNGWAVTYLLICAHKEDSNQPAHITKTSLFKYILNILPSKKENFQIKILIFFHISAQNIDCGYSLEPPPRGGSNEYPQSMI